MLEDGTYDALVVDATDGPDGTIALDVTILVGEHKGEILTITASGLGRDSLDLLAVPATLVVRDGEPTIELEG